MTGAKNCLRWSASVIEVIAKYTLPNAAKSVALRNSATGIIGSMTEGTGGLPIHCSAVSV